MRPLPPLLFVTMGIKNLSKLIGDCAPAAVRELSLKELMGRTIAIDASMAIYQFLVAVRSASAGGNPSVQLTNAAGEVTSHLQGMFNRTIRMMESGIKPVYVFDGKPPQMKSGEVRCLLWSPAWTHFTASLCLTCVCRITRAC